jgi:peptide subunit release factor 1 (eRF1)
MDGSAVRKIRHAASAVSRYRLPTRRGTLKEKGQPRRADRTVRHEPEDNMITEHDLTRLMERPASGVPVVSLFLDLRPGADNRRTHDAFLARQKGRLGELKDARPGLRREDLETALEHAERWLQAEFDPANRGVALFVEAGGEWLEAFQFPVPIPNLLLVNDRPALSPLVRALQGHRRHAVALVDREHLRLLSVWLGRVEKEEEVQKEPYPAAHDVRGGGFDEQRYQRRKLEETRHFFTDFAATVAEFVAQVGADDLILAGTEENVGKFRRFLPPEIEALVVHAAPVPVDASTAEILERLTTVLDRGGDAEGDGLLARLRERAGTGYHAASGLQPTLAALQAGSVEALLLADDQALRGGRCTRCGFLFAQPPAACPYDGAPVEDGVPVVEEALRLARAQGARTRLLSGEQAREFAGAGVLLRF